MKVGILLLQVGNTLLKVGNIFEEGGSEDNSTLQASFGPLWPGVSRRLKSRQHTLKCRHLTPKCRHLPLKRRHLTLQSRHLTLNVGIYYDASTSETIVTWAYNDAST